MERLCQENFGWLHWETEKTDWELYEVIIQTHWILSWMLTLYLSLYKSLMCYSSASTWLCSLTQRRYSPLYMSPPLSHTNTYTRALSLPLRVLLSSPLPTHPLSLQCFWVLSSTVEIKEQRYLLPFILGGCHANVIVLPSKKSISNRSRKINMLLADSWLDIILRYNIIIMYLIIFFWISDTNFCIIANCLQYKECMYNHDTVCMATVLMLSPLVAQYHKHHHQPQTSPHWEELYRYNHIVQ